MKNKQSANGKNNHVINVQGNNNIITPPSPPPPPQTGPSGFGKPVYLVEKTKETPVKIFNNHVKNSWILISSIVGFLADAIAIVAAGGYFKVGQPWLILLPFSFILLLIYMAFRLGKFFKLGRWNILNKNGKLYFTDYAGTCPECGGKLSFAESKEEGTYVWCQYYPIQHRAAFNPLICEE